MKRLGSTLLGIWLIVTGILNLDLITISGTIGDLIAKGMPILAIVAGILILVGK